MGLDERIAQACRRLEDARLEAEVITAAVREQRKLLAVKLEEVRDFRYQVRQDRSPLREQRKRPTT
jgi:hypothetical protein